jgi:acetyltransferase-like isoleucine patch superfamily enzyme
MLVQVEGYKNLRVSDNVELRLGCSCHFNGMVIHNDGATKCSGKPTVTIGSYFHSGQRCVIRTSDHDFRRGYPMVNGNLAGYAIADVTIGDYVWFGDQILVMKGITIGDGAVIQARSVVVSNVPPLAIAGGHPCRPFAWRTAEDFDFFKDLGMQNVDKGDPAGQRTRFEEAMARRFPAHKPNA